jgi:hypothetical protein
MDYSIMLGVYDFFPKKVHKLARFYLAAPMKRVQQHVIQRLHETSRKTYKLEDLTYPSVLNCRVVFEFGIAEDNNFTYLNQEERDKILNYIEKEKVTTLDFFCTIRYYKKRKNGERPLKFDYYLIRMVFHKNEVETQVFHERGLKYITPEDVNRLVLHELRKVFTPLKKG